MSSSATFGEEFAFPVKVLEYLDISAHPRRNGSSRGDTPGAAGQADADPIMLTASELASRIERERAEAARDTEQRLRKRLDQELAAARTPMADLLKEFSAQRDDYFARVEAEVVQLALSIAGRILHREAQVDPMLVAALVRITIEKMREGSSVTVRVSPDRGESWKQYFAGFPNLANVSIAEDPQLDDHDCVLETSLGSANFGLDTQLKEVEQGFFDLLALRPAAV